MSLGVLNNISAVYAQNNLTNTQASLSKTLQQLSSGSRINSGADDAAGLSLANGLEASSTALSQSAKNASEGVDMLQVADGALSQVTSLLNRAVTLATEASNGTLNPTQQAATQAEYSSIMNEIDTIGSNTEYNGINVFQNAANIFTSDGTTSKSYATSALVSSGYSSSSLSLSAQYMVGTTAAAAAAGTDSLGHSIASGDFVFTDSTTNKSYDLTTLGVTGASATTTSILSFDGKVTDVTSSAPVAAAGAGTDSLGNAIAIGDNVLTVGGNKYNLGSDTGTSDATIATNLNSVSGATQALTAITNAISQVAADRGTLGANINTLTAVENVQSTQSTNTLAAENDVTATDYGQATSDMSKYQILMQTGIAALAQANSTQQLVTKLLQ